MRLGRWVYIPANIYNHPVTVGVFVGPGLVWGLICSSLHDTPVSDMIVALTTTTTEH